MTDDQKATLALGAATAVLIAGLALSADSKAASVTETDDAGKIQYVADKGTLVVPADVPLDSSFGLVTVAFQALPNKQLAADLGGPKGYSYLVGSVCVLLLADGGPDEAALDKTLPPGAARINEPLTIVRACKADDAKVAAFSQDWLDGNGAKTAPFPCACSSGSACSNTSDSKDAPVGVTLSVGSWTGAGCIPKVCVELLGSSSWPDECPL